MKKIIAFTLLIAALQACSDSKICGENCKKETAANVQTSQNGIIVSDTSKELSFKLTTAELQTRRADVLSLFKK